MLQSLGLSAAQTQTKEIGIFDTFAPHILHSYKQPHFLTSSHYRPLGKAAILKIDLCALFASVEESMSLNTVTWRKCSETSLTRWDASLFTSVVRNMQLWIAIYILDKKILYRELSATVRLEQHKGVLCINYEVAFCCKQNISPM